MNQNQYIKDADVSGFINFLKETIKKEEFPDRSQSCSDHGTLQNNKTIGRYKNLKDAFLNYQWNNKNYCENVVILSDLNKQLISAVDRNDDAAAFITACRIIDWGGVQKCLSGLINKYSDNNLLGCIKDGAKYLTATHDADLDKFGNDKIIMNAGWTKIYSVLNANTIIYDGRVGSALCSLVRVFLGSKCNNQKLSIPDNLAFTWGPGQGTADRDPNCSQCMNGNKLFMKHSPNDGKLWAKSNLYANWILADVVADQDVIDRISHWANNCKIQTPEDRLRALEASLFMLGENAGSAVCKKFPSKRQRKP